MSSHNAHFKYLSKDYQLVLRSSYNEDEFYGVDEFESKKLKIIQARYSCRHFFHTLPDNVTLDLHKFTWNAEHNSFEAEKRKVVVQLNTLEEAIVEHHL